MVTTTDRANKFIRFAGISRPTQLAMTVPAITLALTIAAEASPHPGVRAVLALACGLVPLIVGLTMPAPRPDQLPPLRERLARVSLIMAPLLLAALHFSGVSLSQMTWGAGAIAGLIAVVALARIATLAGVLTGIGALAFLTGLAALCEAGLRTTPTFADAMSAMQVGEMGAMLTLFGGMLFIHAAFPLHVR